MHKPRVTFVLPDIPRTATGGAKMVFIYSNYLVSKGFDVTICFNCKTMLMQFPLPDFARRFGSRILVKIRPSWFPLDQRVKKLCVFEIDDSSMPDSDHIFATWVGSARPVSELSSAKGKKHYFIQGYETWHTSVEEVEDSYRLGMSNIVVSDWLASIVGKACGIKPRKVKNPIDEDVFFPTGENRFPHEIALLYHPNVNKGFDDALAALKIARNQVPDLTANIFGGPKRPKWLPDWCCYTRNASSEQLRHIYSRSSIFLCAAVNEGFGLTCAESMFCGCALVSTDFQGVFEYADGTCALISPVHDVDALASNLIKLLLDPGEARRIARLGSEHAKNECSLAQAFESMEDELSAC